MLSEGIVSIAHRTAACELTRELANLMVSMAAAIARARRSAPPAGPIAAHLRDIDDAFAAPIGLAQKLIMAVHASHDCPEPPVL